MWIVILIALTTAGFETHALPATFKSQEKCERVAVLTQSFSRAQVDDPEAPIWATCYEIPKTS